MQRLREHVAGTRAGPGCEPGSPLIQLSMLARHGDDVAATDVRIALAFTGDLEPSDNTELS